MCQRGIFKTWSSGGKTKVPVCPVGGPTKAWRWSFLFDRTMKSGEWLQQIRCINVYLPEVSQFRQFIIKQSKSFSGTGWVSFDLSQALQAYDPAKVEELRQNFVRVIFHGHVGDVCLDHWNQGEVRESVLGLEGREI